MDKKTFDKYRDLIYEKSGISLSDGKDALVSARVSRRMRTLGISEYEDYLAYVLEDSTGSEVVHLLDVISTNVTSFYREPVHFDFLSNAVKKWSAEGQSRFRFWSAASSTGEEPYSMAITLKEAISSSYADVKILATDISTRVLEACSEGEYDYEKVKPIPPGLLDKYFQLNIKDNKKSYKVKDSLKQIVSFRRLNLSTPPFPMKGPFDAIFCRNVMIYFDAVVRKNLVEEIYKLLKPGGYFMVGHAESLTGLSTNFKVVSPSIYQK